MAKKKRGNRKNKLDALHIIHPAAGIDIGASETHRGEDGRIGKS
jgi:hypothetical protein